MRHLLGVGRVPCVTPQVLYEYWVVLTRPIGVNGLGLSPEQAAARLDEVQYRCYLLEDRPPIFSRWRRLVETHSVSGKRAHDARLVASMHEHGVENLVTFNLPDFADFAGISVVHQNEVPSRFARIL